MTRLGSPKGERPEEGRAEAAPPRESGARLHRTGFLLLAASGLVLTTGFAAVAQISSPNAESSATAPQRGPGGPLRIPGNAQPGQGSVTINGEAVPGDPNAPSSSASPTTVVTIGTDGHPTTTILPPPANPGVPVPPGTELPPGTGTPPWTPPGSSPTKPTTKPPTSSKPPTSTPPSTSPPSSTTPSTEPTPPSGSGSTSPTP